MIKRSRFVKTVERLCRATTTEVFDILSGLGFEVVDNARSKSKSRIVRDSRRYAYRVGATADAPLIVCHADTVENGGDHGHKFSYNRKAGTVHSIALDDRLGIAVMVYGIESGSWVADCSMLVCDEEEVGMSTATEFAADNAQGLNPAWMVELDRRGSDAVMYDYGSPIFASLLMSVGFHLGIGSFSDICYLDSLGIVGFNIGIGYDREHTNKCNATLSVTESQLEKLHAFYKAFGKVQLSNDENILPSWRSRWATQSTTDAYGYSDDDYGDDWRNWPGKQVSDKDLDTMFNETLDLPFLSLTDKYGDDMTEEEVKDAIDPDNWDVFTAWISGHTTPCGKKFFTSDVEDFGTMYGLDFEDALEA